MKIQEKESILCTFTGSTLHHRCEQITISNGRHTDLYFVSEADYVLPQER